MSDFMPQMRDPNGPELPLKWKAEWYVDWREWMIGVQWKPRRVLLIRVKLGPFGVSLFKTLDHRYASISPEAPHA